MHIPSSESQKLEIEPFADALLRSGKSGAYDAGHWIYVPDYYTEYRYVLGTKGKRPLICIGINPSTAEPDNLDNTLKSVSRIADANGFDSWIMFNVYAQRATRPDDMDLNCNEELHRENMAAFSYIVREAAKENSTPVIWAAWGAIIEKRAYLADCVRDMIEIGKQYAAEWVCAGKCSVKGHPHHPLYLKKNELIHEFPVEEYLKLL